MLTLTLHVYIAFALVEINLAQDCLCGPLQLCLDDKDYDLANEDTRCRIEASCTESDPAIALMSSDQFSVLEQCYQYYHESIAETGKLFTECTGLPCSTTANHDPVPDTYQVDTMKPKRYSNLQLVTEQQRKRMLGTRKFLDTLLGLNELLRFKRAAHKPSPKSSKSNNQLLLDWIIAHCPLWALHTSTTTTTTTTTSATSTTTAALNLQPYHDCVTACVASNAPAVAHGEQCATELGCNLVILSIDQGSIGQCNQEMVERTSRAKQQLKDCVKANFATDITVT